MEMESEKLVQRFGEWVGKRPAVFRAAGRVNLIGEHTDYNDGFVMPSAIGLVTRVGASTRDDRRLVMRSRQFSGEFDFDVDHLPSVGTGQWCDYETGAAVVLKAHGDELRGADTLVKSERPI